jgi:hypothetical protein
MFTAQQKKKDKFLTDNSFEKVATFKHLGIIKAKQNIHDETEQIKFRKCQPPFNYEYLNQQTTFLFIFPHHGK